MTGSGRLSVGIDAVTYRDRAETVAHLLNRPVNHALVGLFSADVKHLVESVLEHYRRRLLVEAGDLDDVVNAVTVETFTSLMVNGRVPSGAPTGRNSKNPL